MPITGSDPALMYAQCGVMRCGASRSGYFPTVTPLLYIGGVRWDARIIKSSLSLDLQLGEPSSLSFEVKGPLTAGGNVPSAGPEVLLCIGSKANRLFAGNLIETEVRPVKKRQTRTVRVRLTCADYTWQLQRRRVTGRLYENRAPITILHDLVSSFPTAVRPTINIHSGFSNLTFQANHAETFASAIDRLATRCGARWQVDARNVLHFFTTIETPGRAPNSLLTDGTHYWDVGYVEDVSQPRTRTLILGRSTTLSAAHTGTETTLAVTDGSIFASAGGYALTGPNLLTYTGVSGNTLTGVSGWLKEAAAGDEVRLMVRRISSAAVTALATRIGNYESGAADDGHSNHLIDDPGLTADEAAIRGDAELGLYSAEQQLEYSTRDSWAVPGQSVSATITQPKAISGSFEIHTVRITEFGRANVLPKREVQAGNVTIDLVGLLALSADTLRMEGKR